MGRGRVNGAADHKRRTTHEARVRRSGAAAAIAVAGIGLTAGTVAGQPVTQESPVNVNLTDIAVQVPIGVAANICDVTAAVLVRDLRDDSAACTPTPARPP